MAGRFDGVVQGLYDGLVQVDDGGHASQVFGYRLARYRQAMAMQQPFVEQVAHHGRHAAVVVQVLHQVAPAGLEVCQYRRGIAHSLEIVLRDVDAYAFSHSDEMQYRIGTATQHDDDAKGVFEGFARHDVRGLDVALQQYAHVFAGLVAFPFFLLAHRWVWRRIGEAHAQGLDGGGHRIGRVHATAGTCARAGMLDNAEEVLIGQV